MSEPAIRVRALTKDYRLYRRPRDRVLDAFGWLRHAERKVGRHRALDGVDLEIARGEKVAIIGRNGAGKTTLLRLLTGATSATSGEIEVHGRLHALLEIGTGFHPDLSGRENAMAYLAHLGVTGAAAKRELARALAFAEIGRYADQPLKAYSAGMAMRLMFSAATGIAPDILVLDEVLGVGDAYFSQKSAERIRELSRDAATTVVLVSHDIYQAARLCDRLIWLDAGRVRQDGAGADVIGAYEESIREQEERRLRRLKQERLRERRETRPDVRHVAIELRAGPDAPPGPVYFERLCLLRAGHEIAALPIRDERFDPDAGASVGVTGSRWGPVVLHRGRAARAFLDHGSPLPSATATFELPAAEGAAAGLEVGGSLASDVQGALSLRVILEDAELSSRLAVRAGPWREFRAPLAPVPLVDTVGAARGSPSRFGTGAVDIRDLAAFDPHGRERHHFAHGAPFELRVRFAIRRPDFDERVQLIVALQRNGVEDVCRFFTRDLAIKGPVGAEGVVRMRVARLPVVDGRYAATVMIAREGYYDEAQDVFYSINPGVLCCLPRALELVVEGAGAPGRGTGVLCDADWSIESAAARESGGVE